MKSITYLGIAFVAFTNVALALNCQQSSNNEETSLAQLQLSAEKFPIASNEDHSGGWKSSNETGKQKNGDPSDVIAFSPYEKSFQELIEENNQIIENSASSEIALHTAENNLTEEERIIESINSMKVSFPCYERTMAEIIAENNKIIESGFIASKSGKIE